VCVSVSRKLQPQNFLHVIVRHRRRRQCDNRARLRVERGRGGKRTAPAATTTMLPPTKIASANQKRDRERGREQRAGI